MDQQPLRSLSGRADGRGGGASGPLARGEQGRTSTVPLPFSAPPGDGKAQGGRSLARPFRARLPRLTVAVIGFGSAVAIARATGADGPDTAGLIGLAGGTAAVAAGFVALVGRALATRPLRTQVAAVAIGSLIGVGIGALVGARAMFLSEHDTEAITVLLVSAGTVGVLAALTLTDRLDRSLANLGSLVQQLETGRLSSEPQPAPVAGPPELASLAAELRDVRARLDEANRRQRSLERSRGELITWVSHDLADPLARIRHLASDLDDTAARDDTAAGAHHELRCEVDRLASIVDDLLELSGQEIASSRTASRVATTSAPAGVFDLAFVETQTIDGQRA